MGYYVWNPDKNLRLKATRGISFEEIVLSIDNGGLIGVYEHPNRLKYPHQNILVVKVRDYAYLVPFVDSHEARFLKTIIPSRKATRDFIGGYP